MKQKIFIFMIFTFSWILNGQSLRLNLSDSLNLALKNNGDILNASSSLEQSQKDEKASWNLWVPALSASVSASEGWSMGDGGTNENFSVSPSISISYAVKPSLKEQMQQLALAVETAALSYEKIELQLRMNVERAFYYLLTSQNNLEIYASNMELAEKSYRQTEVQFKAGRASSLQLLQAQVNRVNMQPTYSSMKAAYENNLKEFMLTLGLDPQVELQLEGSLDIESFELQAKDLIDTYLNQRQDLMSQRLLIEKRRISLEELKAGSFFPSISLSGSYSKSIQNPFMSDQAIGSDNISLGLRLGFSLNNYLSQSTARRNIENMEVQIQQDERNLEVLLQNAALEISNLVNSLDTDKETIALSVLNLELAQTSYDLTAEQYNVGRVDRLTLENAQQELMKSKHNLLESKYQYISDLISLKGALGIKELDL